MTPSNGSGPDFTTKLEGRAYAHFKGPHSPDSLRTLCAFLRAEKWTGSLMIHFSQGGITDAIFEEVKRATAEKS